MPIVVSSPHSGRLLPVDLSPRIKLHPSKLKSLEDGPVDKLIESACEDGATLISAIYSRAFVDLNRHPIEIDPDFLKDGRAQQRLRASVKARAGLGVVPTRVGSENLYDEGLRLSEIERRLKLAWQPYHDRLEELVEAQWSAFGIVLLLDCHSMPSEAVSQGRRPVDVALGDRYGKTCDARIVERVESFLTEAGLRVGRNQPYAGGYITERTGRPWAGRHALQIEFRRSLFIDEDDGTVKPGLAVLGELFRRLVRDLASQLRDLSPLLPRPLAAE